MTEQTNPPAYTLPAPQPSGPGTQPYNGQVGQNPPVIAIQAGQPVQMYAYGQTGSPARIYANYLSKQSTGLGITQVVMGVLCIVFNAVGIAYWSTISIGCIGIWGGVLFIISGAFGISAAKVRSKCKIIAFMVLSIISAGITVPLLICAVIGAVIDNYETCYSYYYEHNRIMYSCSNIAKVAVAMNCLLACLAIIEAIAAIWGSVICCKVACCCSNSGNQIMAPIQYATIQGQPVIIISQPQLNFGGQVVSYAPPEYTNQQIVTVSAPPYSAGYEQDNAAAATTFIPQPKY